MVKIVVTAPRGAMDSLVVQEAFKHDDIQVVGCVGRPDSDIIGRDAGHVCGLGKDIEAKVYDSLEASIDGKKLIDMCDVVVDYSSLEMSMDVLEKCVAHNKALLCGTTGFSDEQLAAFEKAAEKIALMQTANTSYVVTVMKKLLREAAEMLEGKAGMEIIEAHSETKLDAPSGTAIELAEEMASGMKKNTIDDITYHSLRSGNTPSSHHVIFGCQGEMFQINHDAYDWRCYAIGACDAVMYLASRAEKCCPGSYSMFDVIEG